ncbi:MAG TPA: tyrosine-type recombinase/integrase [Terracidiphilus sp.]
MKTSIVPVVLGARSQMTKSKAREELEREMTKLSGQSNGNRIMNDGSVTFGWFVRNRFFPLKEAQWKEETAKVKKWLIENDLVEEFDDVPLENFDKFTLQVHLNKIAKTRSKDRVLQIRAYLRDIFAEAADQDFLSKDPARKVRVPAQLRDTDKTTLTWDQLRSVLAALNLQDRLLLELDMTNALRPSELFALRWKCFHPRESTITIQETVYKGKIRPWGKTRRSLATVPLPMRLSEELSAWKNLCPDQSPEAFIFPGQDGSFLDAGNFRRRVLLKLEQNLGLPKLNFQVIRRTTATLAQKMGTVKDVQGLLRHSRTATTTDVYMQEIPEGVRATVDSIHRELKSEGSSKPKENNRVAPIRKQKTSAEPIIETEEQRDSGSVVGKGVEVDAQNSAPREKSFRDLLPNATNQPVCKSVSY